MLGGLTPEEKAEKAIALGGIAEAAQKMIDAGGSDLDVQTFIQGSRRELARQRPDTGQMGSAVEAAKAYQSARDKAG